MHREDINAISGKVVRCVYRVYQNLGPGLLESIYEKALLHEIRKYGLHAECQVPIPVVYEGHDLGTGYRLDLFVENEVIVEVKSIDTILPVHEAQLLTYLRIAGKQVGLLLNFNVNNMRKGIIRRVL
jgi:GxxExxY protein